MKFPRLTWTARDVGGPSVEPFGGIYEMAHLPLCKAADSKELLWNCFPKREAHALLLVAVHY